MFHALALVASRTWINRVSINPQRPNGWPITKRRIRGSSLLRVPGNLLFRLRSPAVCVLGSRDWQVWEQLVSSDAARVCGRSVEFRRLPGTTLSDLLAVVEPGAPCHWTIHRASVTAAVEALFAFHSRTVDHSRYGNVELSHGDAAVSNVMIDDGANAETSPSAVWFDFDVGHDLSSPAVDRHADDLRAFLFTAAMLVPPDSHCSLVSTARAGYPRKKVWQRLAEQLSAACHGWDLFHKAQCLRSRRQLRGRPARLEDRHAMNSLEQQIVEQILKIVGGSPPRIIRNGSKGG